MSPSDRRTASRGDTAPDPAPSSTSTTSTSTTSGARVAPVDRDGNRTGNGAGPITGPIAVPEIVPATDDGPAGGSTGGPPAKGPAIVPDATDRWVDSGSEPVVVAAPTPAAAPLRVRGRRPRVRKVTRVVRHLDPWSTFKVAAVFSLVLYGVMLTSGVLLWNVAVNTGTVDNVERWFTQFGWETFELNGGEIYHNAWIAGLFGVVALTGFAVLLVTLFNLVSDMVGGVRVTVLEEEVVERTTSQARRYVVRRMPDPAGSPPTGDVAWHDDATAPPADPAKPWRTATHRSSVRTARPVDN